MSSTGRDSNRLENDYYVTPKSAVSAFLKEFAADIQERAFDAILDPCAGGDAKNKMTYPEALQEGPFSFKELVTLDIRADSLAEFKEFDYLKNDYHEVKLSKPNLIISNPPFCFALEFIKRSIELVSDDGYVVMLLRLNFFGSEKRKEFLQTHPPELCYIHSKRMSFTPDGKTDSIEYAHFVWRKKPSSKWTQSRVI